jgi:hypothetical protein
MVVAHGRRVRQPAAGKIISYVRIILTS